MIEEEWQKAEWLEWVLHVAIVKTRKDVYSPLLKRIALCEKLLEGKAGGLERLERLEAGEGWRARMEGALGRLRDEVAKALAMEESALAALVEASGKAAH